MVKRVEIMEVVRSRDWYNLRGRLGDDMHDVVVVLLGTELSKTVVLEYMGLFIYCVHSLSNGYSKAHIAEYQ